MLLMYNNHWCLIVISVAATVILMSVCIIILALVVEHKIKKMTKYLSNREELFNAIGSNIEDIFIIFNVTNHTFEYISPNMEKLTEVKRDTLIHDYMNLLKFILPKEKKRILELLKNPLKTDAKQFEFQFNPYHCGRKRWLQLRIYPTETNNVLRYIISITNITKEKEAQFIIEESLQKVKKANEAKKEFLSHVSHELKTPINAIIGMTQIAYKNIDDKAITENCLNKIDYASGRLLEMINDILDMSRIDNHKLTLRQEPFFLSELITKFSSMVLIQAEAQDKTFTFALNNILDDSLVGDSNRLLQIIENCTSNAMKFTPAGGKIILEVIQTGTREDIAQMRFIISDTGKGMCEEYLKRIFIPFEQEDSNISKTYGGTGLGMTIAKKLVTLMQGNIQVASKINIGTTVTIDIPFPRSHSSVEEKQNYEKVSFDAYDCSGKRALVVEDNEINLEITCEFLKYLNLSVETATNGTQAIHLFEASEAGYYDYILMDIKMSELDGYETTRAIRKSKHPDARKICIIAMTADNFAEEKESIDCGMNYHITKPIDIHYFCSLLHNSDI